jgi:hypothetical protein
MSDNSFSSSGPSGVLSHDTNWTGSIPSTAGKIFYVKVGNLVTLQFSLVQAISTSTGSINIQTNLPNFLWPSVNAPQILFEVIKNGIFSLGQLQVDNSDGYMFVTSDLNNGSFTTGQSNGFNAQYVSYFTN